MINVIVMIIILVIGGIVYYNISKDDDDKGTPATTSGSKDIAGSILRGFSSTESFINIEKCYHDDRKIYDCNVLNSCQFKYIKGEFNSDNCEFSGNKEYDENSEIKDDEQLIWTSCSTRKQPLKYIEKCNLDSNLDYLSKLSTYNNSKDINIDDLLNVNTDHKYKIMNIINLLTKPFLIASSIIDKIIKLVPYVSVYDCENSNNLPCECRGFHQYKYQPLINEKKTNEEKAEILARLLFGYDESIDLNSNITRIEGNIWLMFNMLNKEYGKKFCMSDLDKFKKYITDFNNGKNPKFPNDISEVDLAVISLVFTTIFICMTLGVTGNPRSNNKKNIKFSIHVTGDDVNIFERFKYKQTKVGFTTPPEVIGKTFGINELMEEDINWNDTEYISMVALFIGIVKGYNERFASQAFCPDVIKKIYK